VGIQSVRTAARVNEECPSASVALYHFPDGFLQDLQGEVTQCHAFQAILSVVPSCVVHQDEIRFECCFFR